MYYPIIALKNALKDVKATRELLIALSFPNVNEEEITKIDIHIHEIEKAIDLLSGIKKTSIDPSLYSSIAKEYRNGTIIADIALKHGVSYKTIQRIIKRHKLYSNRYGKINKNS